MLFFALFASLIRIGLLSDQSCRYDLIKAQSNQCCCCSSGHKYKYTEHKYTEHKYKHKYTNQSWLKLNQIRAAEVASKLNLNSLTLHINSNWYVREAQCPVLPRCIQHFSDGQLKITKLGPTLQKILFYHFHSALLSWDSFWIFFKKIIFQVLWDENWSSKCQFEKH